MRSKFLMPILILGMVLISFYEVNGFCSCGYVTPSSSFVDAVFVGTISNKSGSGSISKYEVQVSEIFRGLEKLEKVEVLHKNSNCGSTMFENREYLFLASRDKTTNELTLGFCSYSYKNSGQQRQMIEILRWKRKSIKQSGILVGKVVKEYDDKGNSKKPNEVDKVFAEDNSGKKFEADIENDGFYRFDNLAEGNYKVHIKFPKTLTTFGDLNDFDEDKSVRKNVKVSNGQGTIEDFGVQTNGKISGKVFNSDGTPAFEANVHIIQKPNLYISESTETDKFGFYKFEGLPEGEFFIMVGVTWNNYVSPFWKEFKIPTTYLSNAKSRETAQIIKLSEGEILENQFITLLPTLKKSQLKGKVLMPDGSKANKVQILFQIKREEPNRTLHSGWNDEVKTDSNGKFSLDVYENTEYLFKVETEKIINGVETSFGANCFIVTQKDFLKTLQIKLQKGEIECDEEKFGF